MCALQRASRLYRDGGGYGLIGRSIQYATGRLIPAAVERQCNRFSYPLPSDFERHDNPPNPFRTLDVDPASAIAFSGRDFPPYHGPDAKLGVVKGGDWDRRPPESVDEEYEPRYELYRAGANRFSETTFYRSFEAHFVDGVSWEETRWFQRSLEFIEAGKSTSKGITTREELERRCEQIDSLYRRIRTEGYRSQLSLGNYPVAAKEVIVDVDRDGQLLFVNGRNRLAIAKILGIEQIPVGVYVRHRKWMKYRDSIADAGTVPDHPDLADLS